MEDGELRDGTPSSGDTYDPAFEWPGPGESSTYVAEEMYDIDRYTPPKPKPKPRPSSVTTLRLLVTQTSILPRKQKLVIPDEYTELQFGRDVAPPGTETPRIRLKEMEVSKVHATIFWDKERQSWAIVDMGSKHGTFVKSVVIKAGRVSLDLRSGEDMRGARLSPPRVASVPRRLHHLDAVTIGNTTFVVHIHEEQNGCVGCATGSAHEVPLFSVSKQDRENLKRSRDVAGIDYVTTPSARDPKKALTMLKRSLLTRHDVGSTSTTEPVDSVYMDRSARRRAMHPGSHPDTPGVPNPRSNLPAVAFEPYQTLVTRANTLPSPPPPPVVEPSPQPSAPLPDTNIGHRLLMKQGWQPGTSLGLPDESSSGGLVEPIQVSVNAHRAGLGMPAQAQRSGDYGAGAVSAVRYGDWREDGKQRRWNGVRARG
jgi:pSer/pThr/pTyr-binding forkhead associated (FHA) protein